MPTVIGPPAWYSPVCRSLRCGTRRWRRSSRDSLRGWPAQRRDRAKPAGERRRGTPANTATAENTAHALVRNYRCPHPRSAHRSHDRPQRCTQAGRGLTDSATARQFPGAVVRRRSAPSDRCRPECTSANQHAATRVTPPWSPAPISPGPWSPPRRPAIDLGLPVQHASNERRECKGNGNRNRNGQRAKGHSHDEGEDVKAFDADDPRGPPQERSSDRAAVARVTLSPPRRTGDARRLRQRAATWGIHRWCQAPSWSRWRLRLKRPPDWEIQAVAQPEQAQRPPRRAVDMDFGSAAPSYRTNSMSRTATGGSTANDAMSAPIARGRSLRFRVRRREGARPQTLTHLSNRFAHSRPPHLGMSSGPASRAGPPCGCEPWSLRARPRNGDSCSSPSPSPCVSDTKCSPTMVQSNQNRMPLTIGFDTHISGQESRPRTTRDIAAVAVDHVGHRSPPLLVPLSRPSQIVTCGLWR
jgi:hypothetical protein